MKVDTWGRDVNFEVRQRSKVSLVSWHNVEVFAVPPAKRRLINTATPAFWEDFESHRWFSVAMPLCFSYFPRFLAMDDTSLTSRVGRLAILKCIILTIGAPFEPFTLAFYHGMVVRGCGKRVIALA